MKKRVMKAMLFSAMLLVLTACGKKAEENKEETKQGTEAYNVDDYVTKLGNYIGLEYTKQETEATEEEVEEGVNQFLQAYPEEVKDRTVVEKDDIANIDFEGKKDGKPFDGGTAKGYDLKIGGGRFIPGFEDGLVGKKIGETVDLNLKFPDSYDEESLKGKDVVFTVKINKISAPLKELTDELVAKNSELKTVKEFKDNLKKNISEQKKNRAEISLQTELLKQVIASSEIKEVPKSLMDSYVKEYLGFYEERAKMSNLSLDDYLKQKMNSSEKDMRANAEKLAKEIGEQKLIIEAISKKENIEVSEEDYKAELEEYYNTSGYATQMDKAMFEKTVGKQNIENVVIAKKVLKLLEEKGKEKK